MLWASSHQPKEITMKNKIEMMTVMKEEISDVEAWAKKKKKEIIFIILIKDVARIFVRSLP